MFLETSFDKLLLSTVRLRTRSSNNEIVDASAFIFVYKMGENDFPFLVTACSAVQRAAIGSLSFFQQIEGQFALGKPHVLDIENFSKLWYSQDEAVHNIAITPFLPFTTHLNSKGIDIVTQGITDLHLPSNKDYFELAFNTPLYYAGYPRGLWDHQNNLPIVRRAEIASLPMVNYQGHAQLLVNTPVLPGSEGSPVFKSSFDDRSQPLLLGMLVQATANLGHDRVRMDRTEPSAMGVMIKTDYIVSLMTSYLTEKEFI